MKHIYYDPSNDYVFEDKKHGQGEWCCVVDNNTFGYWRSKKEAEGGMKVEQARAEKRRYKAAKEAE